MRMPLITYTIYRLSIYCNKLSVTYCELWDYKVPYWPFGELHSNAGPDKETVSANWNYTKESASQSELHPSHIPMFSWDQVTTNLPPPSWGVNRLKIRGAVLKNHLQQTDVDFLHCPWNLSTLAFQAKQMRNGCVSCQLVQCDQAAIAVDLRTATHPAIRNSVWAGPVTVRSRSAV